MQLSYQMYILFLQSEDTWFCVVFICFSHHAAFLSIGPHSTLVQMTMQSHINTFHYVHEQTLKPCCWPAHLTVLIKSMSGPFQYYLWGYQVQTTPHNGMAHSVLETIVNVLHLLTICVTVCSILTHGGPLLHCNINNPEGWMVGWFGWEKEWAWGW